MGRNQSLFRRLVFSHLLIILVGFVSVGLITGALIKGFIYETRREQLVRQARQINLALLEELPTWHGSRTEMLGFLDRAFDVRIWLFAPDGKILATSAEADIYEGKSVAQPVVDRVNAGKDVIEPLHFPGLPEPMLSVVVPWGQGDNLMGGLIVHAPVDGLNQTAARVREAILWATLSGMILATMAGSYLSWSISRPLREMELVATEIGSGRYDKRVAVRSADEIGDLAGAINRMAAQLAETEGERKRLEQFREELFANISHELRTPLTAILGFLEALQDGFAVSREQEQLYLTVTYREALHLRRLVEDLMDLSRLRSGRVQLQQAALDPAAVVREVCEQLMPAARKRGNSLRVEVESGGVPAISADPMRLKQILTNLVENANKFTERGSITVILAPTGGGVRIEVADTGAGIPESQLDFIWERFYKADPQRTRSRGGTGLGLAIVRELVTLHGGEVSVRSRVGEGSTFSLYLPGSAPD